MTAEWTKADTDAMIATTRAVVRRDAERVYTADDLIDARMQFGTCRTCGAPRTSKMTEPEPETFQLSMVCTTDESHEA